MLNGYWIGSSTTRRSWRSRRVDKSTSRRVARRACRLTGSQAHRTTRRLGDSMMVAGRGSSLETKRAMFRAAVVAQRAGEPDITANRIVAALLRADTVRELCSRAQIDHAG